MTTHSRRRGDTNRARTLALFDEFKVRKRGNRFFLCLSKEAEAELIRRSQTMRVQCGGLASYYVEKALRS